MIKHKTKSWYCLTHWDKPNKSYCGSSMGVTRWHWKNVTCQKCLALRSEKIQ
jgi:hypothetical protein